MQTVLVTGGAGYVGSRLLRTLLYEDYRTVCVDKLTFGGESLIGIWDHPNFLFYKCDMLDFDTFGHILEQHTYDAIIHLAAIVGDPACKRQPQLAVQTNWEAPRFLLEKSLKVNIPKFIFASTCSNYGKMADPGGYVDERSPLAPVSLYAELKVKFEHVLLHDIPHKETFCPTSLRFATVYGLSHRMRFDLTVNEFTKELALGRELIVFGEQFWRPYCHVRDFSRAILAVLQAPKDKVAYNVFNVGDTRENYTKKMIIEELLRFFPQANITYVKKNEDPRDYRVSFEKIAHELDFALSTSVGGGIQEMKEVLELGILRDPDDSKYYNIPH